MRSAFWLAVYVLLVVAPLVVASLANPFGGGRGYERELAAAMGFIAFGLLVVELALVARLRAVANVHGNDALMRFHKGMGIAALGFLLAHIALLAHLEGRALLALGHGWMLPTGWGASLLLLLLLASSLLRKRLRLAYEPWLYLHRWLALALVGGLLAHCLGARGYARAPAVATTLVLYALLFAALLAWYRLLRPLAMLRRPWEVIENRDEGASTRTLVLCAIGHPGLCFEPGQFVWLSTACSPFLGVEHPLSLSSSPALQAGRRIELSIKELGDWSRSVVPALAPGRRLWLDGPYGSFTIDRAAAEGFVLIAGGIGITPVRSMLLAMRDRGDRRPVLLLYAAHDPSRAPFRAELESLRAQLALRLIYVYEVPTGDSTHEQGFVTQELLRRHLPADLGRTDVFLCGPIPMMESVERSLSELGIAQARIHTERYDLV